jgi:hypothetical protein
MTRPYTTSSSEEKGSGGALAGLLAATVEGSKTSWEHRDLGVGSCRCVAGRACRRRGRSAVSWSGGRTSICPSCLRVVKTVVAVRVWRRLSQVAFRLPGCRSQRPSVTIGIHGPPSQAGRPLGSPSVGVGYLRGVGGWRELCVDQGPRGATSSPPSGGVGGV